MTISRNTTVTVTWLLKDNMAQLLRLNSVSKMHRARNPDKPNEDDESTKK